LTEATTASPTRAPGGVGDGDREGSITPAVLVDAVPQACREAGPSTASREARDDHTRRAPPVSLDADPDATAVVARGDLA
jgi:hypothetical protein